MMSSARLIQGDVREALASLPDDSVDAIVTDPPYELAFMGRTWDRSGIANDAAMWREVWRVAKPGAHLLAFGGTRTHHRMMVALEDAGWEIRDCLMWLFASGFPKSLDVSKAIDRAAGAERVVVGTREKRGAFGGVAYAQDAWTLEQANQPLDLPITAPATPDAERWQGWGTALKPAYEPIVLARKPLSERTVAANVLRWGTGALNIDATRIPLNGDAPAGSGSRDSWRDMEGRTDKPSWGGNITPASGRWPANVLLSHHPDCEPVGTRRVKGQNGGGMNRDGQNNVTFGVHSGHAKVETVGYADADGYETVEAWRCVEGCPVAMLDAQSGEMRARGNVSPTKRQAGNGLFWDGAGPDGPTDPGDTGGASRFFYVAKASREERDRGLAGMPERRVQDGNHADQRVWDIPGSHSTPRANHHPTVKPIELMQYLVRLITPPGGTVLDPFCGSGSTLIAALREGAEAIGIDREAEYIELSRRRIVGDAPLLNRVAVVASASG